MKKGSRRIAAVVFFSAWMMLFVAAPQISRAHCDTLEGPVIIAAREALEKGEVTPVLKWVKKDREEEIRDLFKKTLAVRAKGPAAKELADLYFFETLVRIHRAGEGAPYTGLKKEPVEPILAEADKALEKGSVDHLVKHLADALASEIRKKFDRTLQKKKIAEESVEAGREFVESYVDFTHYVERLHLEAIQKSAHPHGEAEKPGGLTLHKH